MTPAELADRVGHYACTVEGSVVLDRASIAIGQTRSITVDGRSMELIRIEPTYRQASHALTPGDLRVVVMHLRTVAAEWERVAQIADDLAATKPAQTAPPKLPRRHKRGPAARWQHLDMDPPTDTVSAGK